MSDFTAASPPAFFVRREAQERALAERSEGIARLLHLDLAARYAALIRETRTA